jgi:hypothetical protein
MKVAQSAFEALVQGITIIKVRNLYHDTSAVTGEQVVMLALAETTRFHESKMK